MAYGSLVCFTTVIEFLIIPFKYKEPSKLASSMLLAAIVAGIISSYVFIMMLKRTRAYKKILIIGMFSFNLAMIGASIELVCMMLSFNTHKTWFILLITGQVGFFIVPLIPIILDFGC